MSDFRRYGFDFTINQPEIEQISMIAMENDGGTGMFDTGVVRGSEFFMRGMTADMVKKLKEGTAYLKFWIVAIDHLKPTANNKLYPMEQFEDGLQCCFFQQQLHNGGVPGEAEHPLLQMYDKDPNSQINIFNTMSRVCRVDPNNISHYVTAYKVTPEKTYFEIKTNPANPIIVNAILAGKRPAFSIRTRGDFSTREDGVIVANKLEVLTIDYVGNQANASSVTLPVIKAYDCIDGNKKEMDLNLLPKTGVESCGMESVIPENHKLMYDDSLDVVDALGNMLVVPKTSKKTMSFESAMGFACNSFFD